MKLTKTQRGFLGSLSTLNTAGATPSVLQVAAASGSNLSWGQTLYMYRVCKQLVDKGLVEDLASGRTHALRITKDGLRAIGEI